MNILLINDYLEGGGAEALFREQFDILQIDFHVERFYAFEHISDKKISPLSYIYSTRFREKLKSFLEKRSFDSVILHNYSGALSPSILDVLYDYKKANRCRIIYYAHDYHLISPNRGYCYYEKGKTVNLKAPPSVWNVLFKRLDARGIVYSLLKKAQWIWAYTVGKKQKVFDLILAPSDFLTQQIKLRYPDMNTQRMYNVCNSLPFIHPETVKDKSDALRLVYFGRLDPIKGLINFIDAIRNVPVNYSFTIIGEGEELPLIQARIEQYQLQHKIAVMPKLSQTDLFAELQHYDVFVLPTLLYENAPLSVIEAASLGLGLFLSHHGGILEMGKLCNAGHFFNPFDSKDIAFKLKILYEDFLADSLPKADLLRLKALFSRETYIRNLRNYLRHE